MESDTEVALRRRGAELVGLMLVALAALAAAMLWTYSPDDPSLFTATDAAPVNALGLVGASLADPLHRALGWAAYGIAARARGLGPALHAPRGRGPRVGRPSPAGRPARRRRLRRHPRPPDGWPQTTASAACSATRLGRSSRSRRSTSPPRCAIASRSLAAAFLRAPATRSASPGPRPRGFLRFLGQGSVLLYAGAHRLRHARGSGAAEGARAAASFAAEQRARHGAPDPAAPDPPRPAAGRSPRRVGRQDRPRRGGRLVGGELAAARAPSAAPLAARVPSPWAPRRAHRSLAEEAEKAPGLGAR